MTEYDAKRVLADYGIDVTRERLACSADEAVALAAEIGYPVALKIQSAQVLHKTEADAIRLDLRSEDDVRRAYTDVMDNARRHAPDAEIQGVLVQEMLSGGVEIIIGMTRDPVFGPAMMFGLGGVFVEVLKDVSFGIAPLKRRDAEDMLDEINGRKVLDGVRGRAGVDRERLVDALLRVSQLVTDHEDRIEELDINPLLAFPDRICAVDALITRRCERMRGTLDKVPNTIAA